VVGFLVARRLNYDHTAPLMFQRSLARAAHTRTYRAVDLFQQAEAVSQSSSEKQKKTKQKFSMPPYEEKRERGWFGCCVVIQCQTISH
jgi:hypothetical protein